MLLFQVQILYTVKLEGCGVCGFGVAIIHPFCSGKLALACSVLSALTYCKRLWSRLPYGNFFFARKVFFSWLFLSQEGRRHK